VPPVFNTWARSHVDRGHRLEENELFKTMHLYFSCGGSTGSKAAAIRCHRLEPWPDWMAENDDGRRPHAHAYAAAYISQRYHADALVALSTSLSLCLSIAHCAVSNKHTVDLYVVATRPIGL